MKTAAILLAGGLGTRMGALLPKQFLPLRGKPIALYSFELFQKIPLIDELIVVCAPEYRSLFAHTAVPVKFALPGERRQDSVWNGFEKVSRGIELICVHDSARPLIDQQIVTQVLQEASLHGAAVVAVPLKSTIKESKAGGFVSRTLDRKLLWEIQTPQVARREFLEQGFKIAREENLTVTDDVSLVELLRKDVKLVTGSYANIKITTPDDLHVAEALMGTG